MLGNFSCVLLSADFFQDLFFRKILSEEILSVSNNLDPYQAQHFIGPDLGPNFLQRLSADATSKHRVKVGVVFRKVN